MVEQMHEVVCVPITPEKKKIEKMGSAGYGLSRDSPYHLVSLAVTACPDISGATV